MPSYAFPSKLAAALVPLRDDFLASVGQPDAAGCVPWTGKRNRDGYGVYYFRSFKMLAAHRLAVFFARGNFLRDRLVCHTCDHPWCVNPDHLVLGSPAWNMRDAAIKGRKPGKVGQCNGNSRLTERDVIEIRRLLALGKTQAEIAVAFGVSQVNISHIKSGKSWTCL
jgi:hypothetical protein